MRIWLDSLVANTMQEPKDTLTRLMKEGHTIVVANTVADMRVFQMHIMWFEEMVCSKKIIIEVWNTPDEMVAKPFYWSSLMTETPASTSLRDAVSAFQKAPEIIEIANIIDLYGIKKGNWKMGPWAPPENLTEAAATELGIPKDTDNRTVILQTAKKVDKMDVFDAFNFGYNRGLATQHCCDAILNTDGSYTKL